MSAVVSMNLFWGGFTMGVGLEILRSRWKYFMYAQWREFYTLRW